MPTSSATDGCKKLKTASSTSLPSDLVVVEKAKSSNHYMVTLEDVYFRPKGA